jgi:hypothetical protein
MVEEPKPRVKQISVMLSGMNIVLSRYVRSPWTEQLAHFTQQCKRKAKRSTGKSTPCPYT